jgi:hypothetical protein
MTEVVNAEGISRGRSQFPGLISMQVIRSTRVTGGDKFLSDSVVWQSSVSLPATGEVRVHRPSLPPGRLIPKSSSSD